MCSPPALLAEYGLRGASGSLSRERPSGTLPYTSSVLTSRKTSCPCLRAASHRTAVPRTSVSMNAKGSSSERSTCVSAAKFTIASTCCASDSAFVIRRIDIGGHVEEMCPLQCAAPMRHARRDLHARGVAVAHEKLHQRAFCRRSVARVVKRDLQGTDHVPPVGLPLVDVPRLGRARIHE